MNYQPPQPGAPVSPPQPGAPVSPPQPGAPVSPPQPGAAIPTSQFANPAQVPTPAGLGVGQMVQNVSNPYGTPSASGVNQGMSHSQVDAMVIDVLRRTKGWVQFFAVLVFLGTGLMLLMSLGMMSTSFIGGLVSIAITSLYFYPGLKLWQFGSGINTLMRSSSSVHLADALDKQRVFWKFTAILTIVGIALYAILLVFVISTVTSASGAF